MKLINKYFPTLTSEQRERFEALDALYHDWNAKINVISRKDIENLYEHHVLHSLGIAHIIHFKPGTTILDLGTGGGFPGIPLAILFPDCQFHLLDKNKKKVYKKNMEANTMTNTKTQNYDLFYKTIKSLSYSQGSYGRLLREIDSLGEEDKQNLVDQLPDFKEPVDVILFIEQ